ncbi:MAG: immune inhibitor A [Anaerolineales bacterium]|nr:immune inhibitor A [Anaerolineales bacterium]MCB9128199.1 immune inhibitor A [Ardenticatenales bacterium]
MSRTQGLAVGLAGVMVLCSCIGLIVAAGVGIYYGSTPPVAVTATVMRSDSPRGTAVALPRPTAPKVSATPTPPANVQATPTAEQTRLIVDEALLNRAEQTLQAIEQAEMPQRDLFEIAVRLQRIPNDSPRVVSESDPGYQLGDTLRFNVANLEDETNEEQEATLRAQTDHANWWVANDVSIDQAELEASARVFEERSYPTNRELFGSEWTPGIDGDPRLHIFLGNVRGVGGYYSSADEFPRTINPYSNEKEIFYINTDNAWPGTDYFDSILAHEFQHMIHWQSDRNEDVWINEGLSELAGVASGFDYVGGTYSFSLEPDLPLTHWLEQTHPFYESAYLFALYFQQRFGNEAIGQLVAEPLNGGAGISKVLQAQGVSFDALFADWVVANLLDDPDAADGRYDYPNDLVGPPAFAEDVWGYPARESSDVYQYGTDYLRFWPTYADDRFTFEFEGAPIVSLLPTAAHEGDWMMWSNRGDDSNSTLTRRFDLTEVEQATLRYWLWYDLEPDYDYAYIMISTDGGSSWQPLATDATTTDNPHGNSFGAAYNGTSGSDDPDDPSQWIEQSVDLSPYAGQEIFIRFEMVTDDALNQNGVVLDSVEVAEIGYRSSFEGGLDGWEAAGWVRVENMLPQRFIVQAVITDSDGNVTVQPLPLDENNHGTFTVENFDSAIDQIVIAISGATPVTTERARYEYRATAE